YLETNGKNIIININTSVITIANYTVTKVLDILPEYFIRCHKRYIINKKKLHSYDKSTQMVRLGYCSIPVGRKYKDNLEKFLNL
ncbi:MAG TPA: DNA-binding response regulator, partial [Lachnospiraceae bacterium]|nr:DNA-binding response regulator [Lachnospiraceae bacterium]